MKRAIRSRLSRSRNPDLRSGNLVVQCTFTPSNHTVLSIFTYTIELWLKQPGTAASSTSIQYENLKQWCEEPSTFALQGIYELETGKVDKSNTEHVAKPSNRTWALCVTMDAWRLMCGGSEGRCVLWNHREGRKIYSLKGDMILDGMWDGICNV